LEELERSYFSNGSCLKLERIIGDLTSGEYFYFEAL
jgi:hypothetical protein